MYLFDLAAHDWYGVFRSKYAAERFALACGISAYSIHAQPDGVIIHSPGGFTGLCFDWNYGEGHRTAAPVFDVINLDTGKTRRLTGAKAESADRAISHALQFLTPLTSTDQAIFRDIEYRAIRDVVLARLWEVAAQSEDRS